MDHRQKAKDLVALAAHKDTPDKERVVAAMKAAHLIHEHDLLASQLDGVLGGVLDGFDSESVRAASGIFQRITDPEFMNDLKKVGAIFKRTGGGRAKKKRR